MASANGKVTLGVLGNKVDALTRSVDRLIEKFEQHVEEDDETKLVVDRLDQNEKRRIWHIRALWGAVLAALTAWLSKG